MESLEIYFEHFGSLYTITIASPELKHISDIYDRKLLPVLEKFVEVEIEDLPICDDTDIYVAGKYLGQLYLRNDLRNILERDDIEIMSCGVYDDKSLNDIEDWMCQFEDTLDDSENFHEEMIREYIKNHT